MKLCTICDRPLTGTWCKTCKKFVKTYDISNDIHLNVSHDQKNDAGCTYHTTPTSNRTAASNSTSRSYTSTTSSRPATNTNTRTATNTYTSSRTSGTGNSSYGQTPKRSPKKLVGVIIGVYVVIAILAFVIPMFAPLVSELIKESKQEETKKDKEKETEKKETGTKLGSTGTGSIAQMLLRSLEPVDQVTETEDGEEVIYYIYDTEEVEDLYVDCDWEHFSMKRSYFESWTENQLGITMEPLLEQKDEWNYIIEIDDETWAYFISYAMYTTEEEDLEIDLDYDTSSGRIHSIILYTYDHDKYANYFSELAGELDSEYDWDSELLQLEMVYAVEDKQDYQATDIYSSETMKLSAFPFEEGIGLVMNVVVE